MTSRIIPVEPFDLVVIGGAGDLAYRKLLPALYHRHRDGQIPSGSRIIGASRRPMSDGEYRAATRRAIEEHVAVADRDPALIETFLTRLHFVPVDAESDTGWEGLRRLLASGEELVRAFYLAVAPQLIAPIAGDLGRHGLVNPRTRLIIEKPIGHDRTSAMAVNDAVGEFFREHQVYRIDHYLAKETVQNLMSLRFGNVLLEPLWNSNHVDHVQITVAESIGVEGRAAYYDKAGALRDIIQNHMLQVLCLVAMEPPTTLTDADRVRDEKLKVLRALRPIDAGNVAEFAVRGQYGAGEHGTFAAYVQEVNDADSRTETFVALKAEVSNWRWAGVPFYLRTGKRLPTRVSEIVITFRKVPHSIFDASAGTLEANQLVLRLQPDEGVMLWLMIKDPGPGAMRLRYVPLDMSFAEAFGVRSPDAYERLILDVIRGDQTLFMRRDEVEAAWAWIDPITEAWAKSASAPLHYPAGTWGPAAAAQLIEGDGRTWHTDGG